MLKIIDANTSNYAARLAMEELKKNNTPGSKHIVIVPDRFAMSVEKELFEVLELPGAFNIDVVSFTRLAIKTLDGEQNKCLTKEGGIILMSNIISSLEDKLQFYKNVHGKRSLAKDLYAVIASLRSSRISADDLRDAFSGEGEALKKKYADLALIYEHYEESLSTRFNDTLTRLNRFEAIIGESAELAKSDIYVLGFASFKGNEYGIIKRLAECAKSVTVAVCGGSRGENAELFREGIVERLRNAIEDTKVIRCDKKLPEPIDKIYSHLFAFGRVKVNAADKIKLSKEDTPYAEIKAVGLEIKRLIRTKYRYKDIAVVSRDNSYKSVIGDLFSRLEIPHFIDRKYPLKETLIARLVESAVAVFSSGVERERLLSFAKNPLLGILYKDIEILNDYIMLHNLNYQKLNESFGDTEEGKRAQEVRDKIFACLPTLSAKFSIKDGVAKIRSLYDQKDLSIIDKVYGEGGVFEDKILQLINNQAVGLLEAELEEFLSLMPDTEVSIEEFGTLLKSSIESVEVSLIPNVIDSVFVGTNEDSQFFDKKLIFIVGASDGVMPLKVDYHAVMPEKDVSIFEKKKLSLSPTPLETIRRDKAALLDLLTKATDKVYVSYASFSVGGKAQSEGEFFKQLAYMTGGIGKKLSAEFLLNADNPARIEGLGSKENAYYEYLKQSGVGGDEKDKAFFVAVRDYLCENGYANQLCEKTNEENLDLPLSFFLKSTDGGYVTSVTQIECFYKCPYLHFLKYGLGIREKNDGKLKSVDVGIILHLMLEKFFSDTKAKLKQWDETKITQIARKTAEEVINSEAYEYLRNTDNGQRLLQQLKEEGIATLIHLALAVRHSDFQPTYFEYRFGVKSDGAGLEICSDNDKISVRGVVDRVDFCGDDFIVLDYKTGKADDLANTNRLYYGVNLQLYLYLVPFINQGKTPVGAFYVPVNSEYKRGLGGHYIGKLTCDGTLLKAMDDTADLSSLETGPLSSNILPLEVMLKNGQVYANKNANFSTGDFTFAANYACQAIESAVKAMRCGYRAKRPIFQACDYCDYSSLCAERKKRVSSSCKISGAQFQEGNPG